MRISREMMIEALDKVNEVKDAVLHIQDTFFQIEKEKPDIAGTIQLALEQWATLSPAGEDLKAQARHFFLILLTLADALWRGKEAADRSMHQFGERYNAEIFLLIKEENPHLAEFLEKSAEAWQEVSPRTFQEQLQFLFTYLVLLADMFRRQEEVERLKKQLGE